MWNGDAAMLSGDAAMWNADAAMWHSDAAMWNGDTVMWNGDAAMWNGDAAMWNGDTAMLNDDAADAGGGSVVYRDLCSHQCVTGEERMDSASVFAYYEASLRWPSPHTSGHHQCGYATLQHDFRHAFLQIWGKPWARTRYLIRLAVVSAF